MTDPVPEITELQNKIDDAEKRYAAELWKAQQARNALNAMAASNIRLRGQIRMVKVSIGVGLFMTAIWYVGYTVYTLLH